MKELIRNGGNNNPNQLIRSAINLQKNTRVLSELL